MELDYSLKTAEERSAWAEKVIASTAPEKLTKAYLSHISDYILFVNDSNQTKKEKTTEHPILTKNREVTVQKRESSFEEIVSSLENGEDGLYSMITNDKNQIMDHKDPINEKDKEDIPQLKEYLEQIDRLQEKFKTAKGYDRYLIKKQIKEIWQQMYIIKASFKGNPARGRTSNQIKTFAHMVLDDNFYLDENQMPRNDCILSLFNPTHVSFLLCYYTQLKQECSEDFQSDMHFLLLDLEELVTRTLLPDNEILFDLIVWKIDGLSNAEIVEKMKSVHGVTHNEQYYSSLWRKRIPKMIAEQAQKEYLIWHYTNVEYGSWKKCGKCGEIKLAHPMFFHKNNGGYYSICKECRSKK